MAFPAIGGGRHAQDPDGLFQAGQFAAADRGYASLLADHPDDAHAWAQRGYIALLTNRFRDTERFLGTAIRLNPADTTSMSRLADCYVRQDDLTRAVPLLLAAGDRIGAAQYAAVSGSPYRVSGAVSTRLPFLTLDPLPSVTAEVNGVSAPFTLDTGATFALSAATAEAAGVRAAGTIQVNHGAGPVTSYIGVARSLRLGGIEIGNVPVMWDDTTPDVIGTTVFYHFATTMDYAGRGLGLRRGPAPRPAGAAMVAPMWLAPDHFIFSWGGTGRSRPGPVLLDTGGVGLGVVLTGQQAEQAGVTPDYAHPVMDFGVTVYPCTAEVTLGRRTREVPGVVGPVAPPADFGFGSRGTISHEFFKPYSVTFDFGAMTITVAD